MAAIAGGLATGYAFVEFDTVLPLFFGSRWQSKRVTKRYAFYGFIFYGTIALLILLASGTKIASLLPMGYEWLPFGSALVVSTVAGLLYAQYQLSEAPDVVTKIINSMFPTGGSISLGAADVSAAAKVLAFLEKVGGPYRELLFLVATAIDNPLASWYTLGVFTRFTDLAENDRQTFIEEWMRSENLVFRSLASAFKALGSLGYYTDPRIWTEIGFPGSFVPEIPRVESHNHDVPNHIPLQGEPASEVKLGMKLSQNEPEARIFGLSRYQRRSRRYQTLDSDIVIQADVCIVGSGAGGAVVARELARNPTIKRIVMLERGSYTEGEDFDQRELEMIGQLWKGGALTFNQDFSIFIGQGETLGGTTVINHAICIDTPEVVLSEWQNLGVDESITNAADFRNDTLAKIRSEISVHPVPEIQMNKNNRILRDGAAKLGIPDTGRGANPRNCLYCRECGFSHLGCHYDAKQSTLVTYIPQALDTQNFIVICDCYAGEITFDKDHVTGVNATLMTKEGEEKHRVRVDANLVIVSAGAINSSALLLRSKLPGRRDKIGQGLTIHPSPLVIGEFPEIVAPYRGIPMSYHVRQFSVLNGVPGADDKIPVTNSDLPNDQRGGFMLESVFPNPGQFGAFLPGVGEAHKKLMKKLNYYAAAGILIRDTPKGTVSINQSGEPVIRYGLGPHDRRNLAMGIRKLCELYFAEGATRIIVTHREGTIIEREAYLKDKDILNRTINDDNCGQDKLYMGAVHPQGGNRMGEDPLMCVVNSHCQHHSIRNLFVCDASVFPTATGVNPMLTTMGIAKKAAEYINQNWTKMSSNKVAVDTDKPWTTRVEQAWN